MDTVLVTGGTGHLGRDLVARLRSSYRVRVLARSTGSDPDVEWVRGDLATGAGIADADCRGSQTVCPRRHALAGRPPRLLRPRDLWYSPVDAGS